MTTEDRQLVFLGDTDTFSITVKYTNVGYLEWSVNGSDWTYLVSHGQTSCGKIIHIRGKFFTPSLFKEVSVRNAWEFHNVNEVHILGDIAYLLDFENPPTVVDDYAFNHLFDGCEQLVEGPRINTMTGGKSCYIQMFHGCTKLERNPLETIKKSACRKRKKKAIELEINKKIATVTEVESLFESLIQNVKTIKGKLDIETYDGKIVVDINAKRGRGEKRGIKTGGFII